MKNITFAAMAIGAAMILTTSGCRHIGIGNDPILGSSRVPRKQGDPPVAPPKETVSAPKETTRPAPKETIQRPPVRQNPVVFRPVEHPEPPAPVPPQPAPPPLAPTPNTDTAFVDSTTYSNVFINHTEDTSIFARYTVYFELDSSVIRAGEDSKLENIAKYFLTNKTDVLMVEGHCDERGTEQYNMALGDRRALAVREYIIKLGVDNARIRTVSYGESRPADPRHNEAAWKKNRRGFSVLYKALGEPQK